MSPPKANVSGLPSQLFTTETFFTLGGASVGVWAFNAVFGKFYGPHILLLRGSILAVALVISFSEAHRRRHVARQELLVAFFNGLLIYISATGVNAVSTGTDFSRGSLPGAQGASFLPFLNERALWPPIALIREKDALQQEGALLQPKVDNSVLGTERTLSEAKILASVSGKQREVISQALELYHRKIPYKWGGKNPTGGLDSSGYVAYVLSKAGIIDDPASYWSGKLLASLQPVAQEQVGDILFYSSGACMIYLGNDLSIGMLPGGIATGSLDAPNSGFKRLGVRRY